MDNNTVDGQCSLVVTALGNWLTAQVVSEGHGQVNLRKVAQGAVFLQGDCADLAFILLEGRVDLYFQWDQELVTSVLSSLRRGATPPESLFQQALGVKTGTIQVLYSKS